MKIKTVEYKIIYADTNYNYWIAREVSYFGISWVYSLIGDKDKPFTSLLDANKKLEELNEIQNTLSLKNV